MDHFLGITTLFTLIVGAMIGVTADGNESLQALAVIYLVVSFLFALTQLGLLMLKETK